MLRKLDKRAKHAEQLAPHWSRLLTRFYRVPTTLSPWDLTDVAKEVFAPRMNLPVRVCDYFEDHSIQFTTTLADIESCMHRSSVTRSDRETHCQQVGRQNRKKPLPAGCKVLALRLLTMLTIPFQPCSAGTRYTCLCTLKSCLRELRSSTD